MIIIIIMMIIMISDDDDDDDKPKEDFCIAEDGVVESFVTWDLGFASQEALQRKKLLNSIIGRNDLL